MAGSKAISTLKRHKASTALRSGPSRAAIKRLARRGGVKRLAATVFAEIHSVLRTFLQRVINDAFSYMSHARRMVVSLKDVVHALKLRGTTIYGLEYLGIKKPAARARLTGPSFPLGTPSVSSMAEPITDKARSNPERRVPVALVCDTPSLPVAVMPPSVPALDINTTSTREASQQTSEGVTNLPGEISPGERQDVLTEAITQQPEPVATPAPARRPNTPALRRQSQSVKRSTQKSKSGSVRKASNIGKSGLSAMRSSQKRARLTPTQQPESIRRFLAMSPEQPPRASDRTVRKKNVENLVTNARPLLQNTENTNGAMAASVLRVEVLNIESNEFSKKDVAPVATDQTLSASLDPSMTRKVMSILLDLFDRGDQDWISIEAVYDQIKGNKEMQSGKNATNDGFSSSGISIGPDLLKRHLDALTDENRLMISNGMVYRI